MTEKSGAFATNVTPLLFKTGAERVVMQILDLIRSGSVKAGDKLPTESELSRAFGVSRPIVREALRSLAVLGVLETRQGGRCYVTDLTVARLMAPLRFVIALDAASVVALHEARVMIEGALIRAAATRMDTRAAAQLDAMVEAGFSLTRDPVGFRLLDQQFHRALNQLGANPFLEVTAQSLYELGMDYRRAASETPGVIDRSLAEHKVIVDALKQADPDAAARAMLTHLTSIHQTTLDAMRRAGVAESEAP